MNRATALEAGVGGFDVRGVASFMLVCGLAFGAAACTSRTAPAGGGTPAPAPLPAVSPVAAAPLPGWFAAVSPHGEAKDGSQIRVRFKNDVVPVEALESPDRQAVLAHFRLEPALPGRFIVLTPRMIAFQADAPLPHAARINVILSAGLADLAGHRLAADYAWSFTTEPLTLSNLPGVDETSAAKLPAQSRLPRFGFDASDAVDIASLLAHTHVIDDRDASKSVAVQIAPSASPDPSASPGAASDASGPATGDTSVHYDLVPVAQLAGDSTYKVVVDPGVMPLGGNVPTAARYEGKLRTYGPLQLLGVSFDSSDDGTRFAKGLPSLAFSNAIDPASALKAVTLSPAPNASLPLLRVDDDGSIALDSDALAPRTTYTVTVAATLKDTFGQTLGKDATATFETGDYAPNIWAPTELSIFPSGSDLAVNVETTNLPSRAYFSTFRVIKPEDLIASDLRSEDQLQKLLPPVDDWTERPLRTAPNVSSDTALPLRSLLGGRTGTLAYGFAARTTSTRSASGAIVWNEPSLIGAVTLTDLGVFAQWFPEGGQVRVARLSDGSPVAQARVEIYESVSENEDKSLASRTPCATGTTGADGVLRLDSAAFAACASTASDPQYAPSLLTIVRDGADWAYARTSRYVDGYAFNLDGEGWSAGVPAAHGTIFTDRDLYQPGESAKLLGIGYFERNGVLGRGRSASYALTAQTPSGANVQLGRVSLDPFGAFSTSLPFGARAETGVWTVSAKGDDGETLDGTFTVAQFKPPNFKVDLGLLVRDPVPEGTSVGATSKSEYLFGAPVEGGTSHVSVTRAREYFTPEGWDAYAFGRQWWYPEEEPSVTSDVLQRDLPIGPSGVTNFSVPVGTDLPYPMRYTVTAQTTDVSRLAVADTKSFVAVPAASLIGLRADFVAAAGTPFDVDAIVTDPKGAAQSGTHLTLVLQQRLDASVTQVVEGGEASHDAVRYVDVATQDVTSGQTPVKVSFTAPQPGDYRIRANVAGAAGDAGATDRELWITGAGEAAWLTAGQTALTVKLDKNTYRPGDVATALVQSPYADAQLYLAVVRHGVLYQTTQPVHGAAPQVQFKVTPEMLPNAAVEAVLVRRGRPLGPNPPAGLGTLSRIGFAPFEVAFDSKYLGVALQPRLATLEPGGKQHVSVRVTGRDGKPVRGEVALAVVNDAILQLNGYRFPDIAKLVYADQPISTRLDDNRADVKLATEHRYVEKGFGFGGGEMAGPAGTRVRTKFVPLAYWNPSLRTDATGTASVDFALPDDLTTWRVMAVALTADARFGNGDATFIASKALATNPVLPQFARPGDRFSAGVSITNIAKATGELAVSGTLAGGLTYAAGDPRAVQTSAPASGATQALDFEVTATGTQDASVGFKTLLGGRSDAFVFPVPIETNDVLESAVTTGTTRATASVPLNVAASLRGPLGGLDVTLASTLLAAAVEPQAALQLPQQPFLTDLASRIAVGSDAIVLDRTYGRTAEVPALTRVVETNLEALRGMALPDNGFAAWPGASKSELYTTAFAAEQLWQAKLAGFDVTPDLARVRSYLGKALADPGTVAGCDREASCAAEARLEALETLGTLGEPRADFLDDILAHQSEFGYYERIELARQLLRLPAWKARGVALRDELFQNVSLAARAARVDVRGSFGESQVAGQSQMLGLAVESALPDEDIDRLLVSLLGLRHDGRWGCFCDDAEAMNALALYVARSPEPPNFSASVELPTQPARTVRQSFSGYTITSRTVSTPIDALTTGPSTVRLSKSGNGTLHYVVALRYRVPDASPGAYAGLRIDRILRPAASQTPLASFGLALPAGPATVVAGRVFDVEDRIVSDHPVDDVVITDPLPAGFEAVDQSFRTTAPAGPSADRGDDWNLDYQSIYRDRVLSFAQHLDPGSYAFHYLVRSVTPGTFAWPGASVALQYAPEEFGRTAASQLVVTDK
jgi:uncharacterized protein YfaS (alpha-2-macroglobulin family)